MNRYKLILIVVICTLTLLLSSCSRQGIIASDGKAQAPVTRVTIAASTPFAANGPIRQKVVDECELQRKLPHYLQAYARDYGIEVITSDQAPGLAEGTVLELTFTEVIGAGGGAWSGNKRVTVEGILKENGEVLATFKATRESGGGFMAGFKGTCAIFGRCAKALGSDIAKWLRRPGA